MRGYSIKEFVGDVSIEWVYDADTDSVSFTESACDVSTTTNLGRFGMTPKVYMAFRELLEQGKL